VSEVRVGDRPERREAPVAELVDRHGQVEVLQPVLAEVLHLRIDQLLRLRGQQDLAAVTDRRYPRAKMDILAHIPLADDVRPAGVQPDTHFDRPLRELALDFGRGRDRRGCAREGHEERIALRVHLDAAVPGAALADDAPVLEERVRVRLRPELVQQPRRALDVGEQEGHGSRREVAPHGGMMRQMRVYVTGASGFIGGHVVRELRAAGHAVRDEWIDLLDRDRLRNAIAGCDAVFHLAALYSYDAPAFEHERVNVEGTRVVVALCRELGVRRLVHTSTCGTCGPVPGRPATEEDEPPGYELAVPYKRTKLEAERIVLAAARDALDAVVVNPTTPVGDGDRFPTPTGRMIEGVATGRYRGYLDTGVNVVDVSDVARGHLLAWERGARGERYILGGVDLSLRELFAAIADLARRPRPRLRVPYAVARALAGTGVASAEEVTLARLPMYFSSEKARRELGYEPGPVEPALARAVRETLDRTGLLQGV